ncbi:hypothetical protein P3T27_006519 [Kitasatospora sp. MAA19]|nr:hypothetical protein [Kitasatospora sp. MAA19]MDH6709770.1 hypothetical protein [Kitasatospora sp. MAA19]
MGLWSKLTGSQTADTTPTSRADANTAAWLRRGGLAPRKGN